MCVHASCAVLRPKLIDFQEGDAHVSSPTQMGHERVPPPARNTMLPHSQTRPPLARRPPGAQRRSPGRMPGPPGRRSSTWSTEHRSAGSIRGRPPWRHPRLPFCSGSTPPPWRPPAKDARCWVDPPGRPEPAHASPPASPRARPLGAPLERASRAGRSPTLRGRPRARPPASPEPSRPWGPPPSCPSARGSAPRPFELRTSLEVKFELLPWL